MMSSGARQRHCSPVSVQTFKQRVHASPKAKDTRLKNSFKTFFQAKACGGVAGSPKSLPAHLRRPSLHASVSSWRLGATRTPSAREKKKWPETGIEPMTSPSQPAP